MVRARTSSAVVAAALVAACRSYYLVDDPSDAGAGSDTDTADASADAGTKRPTQIFVFGGSSDGTTLPEECLAYAAEILPDGSLSTWREVSRPPKSVMWHASASGSDGLVLVGGIARPSGGNLRIFMAPIEGDGGLGSFASSPDLLPTRIHHGSAFLRRNELYVLGGETGDDRPPSANVWRTTLTATTFGTPEAAAPLPYALSRAAVAEDGERIYVTGGILQDFSPSDGVLRARFDSGGALAGFDALTRLPSPRAYVAAAVVGRSLLVLGGDRSGDIANVLSCPLDEAGDLGPCAETVPLPATRSRHRAVAHDGRVYVVGGRGSDDGRAVFIGDVAASGGVTSWRAGSALPTAAVFTSVMTL